MKLHPALLVVLLLTLPLAAQQEPAVPPTEPEPQINRGEVVNFGRSIIIERGERAGSVVCIGCSIILRGPAQDVVAILGSIQVEGASAADVVAVGGSIDLDGAARGDVVAVGGAIEMRAGASAGGDVVAVGGELRRHATATIAGEVVEQQMPLGGIVPLGGALLLLTLAMVGAFSLLLVVICYPIAGRARVLTLAQAVRLRPGMALLSGLGAAVFLVVLLTLAGLMGPASLFLILPLTLLVFVVLVLGYTGLSFWLGNSIAPGNHPLVLVLLGALLITIIQIIPLLGQLAMLFFLVLALGSVAMTGFGSRLDWLERQYRPAAAGGPPPPPPPAG